MNPYIIFDIQLQKKNQLQLQFQRKIYKIQISPMTESHQELTLEQLNHAYIKLIKMVLNPTWEIASHYINSLYQEPSPEQAYAILSKIFVEEKMGKKQVEPVEAGSKKLQLKRAYTVNDEKVSENKIGGGLHRQAMNYKMEFKSNSPKRNAKKLQNIEGEAEGKEQDIEAKSERLKKISGKISQIFFNNHKKIMKYEEFAKRPVSSFTNGGVTEVAFKKY